MSYRPFVLAAATAALASMHVASAVAQPAYLAPGAIYVGGGPARVYGPAYGYGYGRGAIEAPGHDDGYSVSAHEGYGDECEPGAYGAPGYDHGYGPPPRYRFGYGPGPRYGYGYGPPPRFDYGYGPAPRHGNGYGPPPRLDYGYGPGPAGRYGSGSNQPRYGRPARTAAPAPKSDAAEPPGGSRVPAPFAGQR